VLCFLPLLGGVLLGCHSYDPKLIGERDGGSGGGDPVDSGTAATDAGDGSVFDGADCVPVEEGCEMSCPETCNGQDDDCDGRIDEVDERSQCQLDNAVSVCADNDCLIASCKSGFVDCNGVASDGCESRLDSAAHCGVCGHRCSFPNASSRCDAGTCRLADCESDFSDCDGSLNNGCERSLTTLQDCGACGESCSLANAVTSCETGRCVFARCAAGYGDCNGDAPKLSDGDGCETKLDSPEHCGSCKLKCSGPTPYCSGGRCTSLICDPGRADCDNDNQLCEADLRSLSDCGACGESCGPLSNATVSCATGQCAATCRSGFKDCDATPANGCETSVQTTSNCGQCGEPCGYANATTSCATGTCTLTACTSGYADCNENLGQDGCEQRLNTLAHCGKCNQACGLANAAPSCNSGSCQVASCNSGWGNCDGQANNGCETSLATSNQNCGSCNYSCPSNRTCSGGRCVCTSDANCNSGQTCCNGACVDTRSDEANCGSCGGVCASGSTCCSGACKDLATDFNNCGSCGNGCDSSYENRCASGTCKCANSDSCPLFWRCCSSGCEFGLGGC
jgi:hypothetical protein